jgi:hypothetical protein
MNLNHSSNFITFLSGVASSFRYGVSNTLGWGDVVGVYSAPGTGGTAPTMENFDGDSDLGFNASDTVTWKLHLPHWVTVGGDKFLHVHVGIASAAVASGNNLVLSAVVQHRYHNLLGSGEALRTGSEASKTFTFTLTPAQLNSTAGETWVVEQKIAQSTGSASLFNSDNWLIDDDITVTCTITSFPTLTGGTSQKVRFPFCDEHTEVTWGGTFRRSFTNLSFN